MIDEIKQELIRKLSPTFCEVNDFSHEHNSHGPHVKKASHVHICLQADILKGKTRIQQHQLVYKILDPFFVQGLHAVELNIRP